MASPADGVDTIGCLPAGTPDYEEVMGSHGKPCRTGGNLRIIPCRMKISPHRRIRTRRTWQEKLADDKDLPKVLELSPDEAKRWGGHTMVVARPRDVDAIIREIPRGSTMTVNELRSRLAAQFGTETACPLTTGIFAWISAHASVEAEAAGHENPSPWWRVVKAGGRLNPKFPGGVDEQARRLAAEGISSADGKLVPEDCP